MIRVNEKSLTEAQAKKLGLGITLTGANLELWNLVNGLQGAHGRIETMLRDWGKTEFEAQQEISERLEWLLGAASVAIRQLAYANKTLTEANKKLGKG